MCGLDVASGPPSVVMAFPARCAILAASAVGDSDVRVLAGRAMDALPPGGLVLVHDFLVDDAHEGPPFAAWYLLGSIFDNPNAVCLNPSYVEDVLRQTGFNVERTEVMLPGITMLTRATKVN